LQAKEQAMIRETMLALCVLTVMVSAGFSAAASKVSPDAATLARDNNVFAFDLYSRLAVAEGNLFFSPHSISSALGMTYAGARGKTAEQMATTLHFSLGPDRLHAAWSDLRRELDGRGKEKHYQLNIANALWGQKQFGFLPEFLRLTRAHYGAGLREVDFVGDVDGARQIINSWVAKETHEKIKDLIPPGVLDTATRLVLTNAIYFKSPWLDRFAKEVTRKEDFVLASGQKVPVPMMHQHLESAMYSETETCQMLELPYKGRDLSMVIILPRKSANAGQVEKGPTSMELDKHLGRRKPYMVNVTLPRFKITAEASLKKVLSEMGMPLAFTDNADFSGMSSQGKLFIQAVLHKAYVDVNEDGTEAAAATSVSVGLTSIRNLPRADFRADHPFVFLIRHNATGSILFMGRVANPT
jgi:serpin B